MAGFWGGQEGSSLNRDLGMTEVRPQKAGWSLGGTMYFLLYSVYFTLQCNVGAEITVWECPLAKITRC